jgi:thioredoxin 1
MMQALLYFLIAMAAAFLAMQIVISLRRRKQRGRELVKLPGDFGDAVRSGARVLAYFYSPVCAASKSQTPVIKKLADEYENIFSIDIMQEFEIARAIGVQITPTTVIIEGGEIRDFLVGPRTEEMLREALL